MPSIPESLVTACYLVASVLFILSLGGLSHPLTARRGNLYGIIGMVIALAAAVLGPQQGHYLWLVLALIPAVIIGATLAARVRMTSMPQLVAMLHSFVGLAAVLVGIATHVKGHPPDHTQAEVLIHEIEIFVGVCIGSITFTGSIIAFLKLQGLVSGKPLLIPLRHFANLAMVAGAAWLGYAFVGSELATGTTLLIIATALTGVLGVHLVAAIGGADMPVVVSMLNSYSGWAAAAAGFMLENDLLIITGALVGSSGAILSYIMCRGMNRSFFNVIFGGFGTAGGAPAGVPVEGEITEIDLEASVALLDEAERIVIVPGYGMAVAQAQHALSDMVMTLVGRGKWVRFAIHPVAGRLPGHMNVLLAEAGVPYELVLEMEEVNPDLPGVDVVLVIGANDIVNPIAEEDPTSAIAGMPVIRVWTARTTIVMKRGMASGYAGIDNPLFYKAGTRMLFGDAKASVKGLLDGLEKSASGQAAQAGV
jgi:NAD(P) transhydrogenase subunit beta